MERFLCVCVRLCVFIVFIVLPCLCVADMPQAQALAGCKSQSATKPCRMCHVKTGEDLGNVEYDAKANQRTIWHMREDRNGTPRPTGASPTPPRLWRIRTSCLTPPAKSPPSLCTPN